MDINFKMDNIIFNYRVACLIKKGNKILVEKKKGQTYYSLLGGRVKAGESSSEAVLREVMEETSFDTKIVKNAGIVENFFRLSSSNNKYHELLMIYELELLNQDEYNFECMNCQDNDAIFCWKSIEELSTLEFKPRILLSYLNQPSFFTIVNKDD